MSKRHLPQTFPHRIVFVASLVLCLCAVCSAGLGVISWTTRIWGYYFVTGFWSGGVILLTGLLGIMCSYVRNVCSVKAFMIASIFGCVASLGAMALSAGGLDTNSGFYTGHHGEKFMRQLVHAGNLGISVLQLTVCIFSDGICIYYLFVEKNAVIYKSKDPIKRQKKSHRRQQDQNDNRMSSRSDAPLMGTPKTKTSSRKDKKSKTEKKSPGVTMRRDRVDSLRRSDTSVPPSPPTRSPIVRPASFTTFGRGDGPDRAWLIVHPDDSTSVADTVRSQTPDIRPDNENHYAQTLLFEPPLPIEEDDELPPYEAVDSRLYSNVPPRTRSKSGKELDSNRFLRRTNSTPSNNKRRSDRKSNRRSLPVSQIPPGRLEGNSKVNHKRLSESDENILDPLVNKPLRPSRSVDLLSTKGMHMENSDPGVSLRDFGYSSGQIDNPELTLRPHRSQSFKSSNYREKRLDRRQRALSAEIKLNKDQILSHGSLGRMQQGLQKRTLSIDGSNSGLFASNRTIPTKFSLRTPVRQIGMPQVKSPIAVKSVASLPLFSPPPKPPRTFSTTRDDLEKMEVGVENDDESCVYSVVNKDKSNGMHDKNEDSSGTGTVEEKQKGADRSTSSSKTDIKIVRTLDDSSTKTTNANKENTRSTSETNKNAKMIVSEGPVIKCPPFSKPNTQTQKSDTGVEKDISVDKVKPYNSKSSTSATMVLPTSPLMKYPPAGNVLSKSVVSNTSPKVSNKMENAPTPQTRKSKTNSFKLQENGRESCNEKPKVTRDSEPVVIHFTSPQSQYVPKSKEDVSEKKPTATGITMDSLRDLRVRLPPLSPSEKILRRKHLGSVDKKDNKSHHNQFQSVMQTDKPENKNNISKTEQNGARPKIFEAKIVLSDLESSKVPVTKTRRSVSNENDKGLNENNVDSLNKSKDNVAKVSRRGSEKLINSLSDSVAVRPKAQAMATLPLSPTRIIPNNNSTQPSSFFVPVQNVSTTTNSVQTSSAKGVHNSAGGQSIPSPDLSGAVRFQGVLHLPQSQYSRHVSPEEQPIRAPPTSQQRGPTQGHAINPPNINNVQQNNIQQNNVQQNNNNTDSPDRPLFSVLL